MPLSRARLRLPALALASAATLAACAGSPARPDANSLWRPAPDPVVERLVVVKTICPAELRLAVPPAPVMPDDAVVEAAEHVLAWLAAHWRREALLEERLIDARTACPDD